jgi:membrane protein YdbS with pleckstrin-like domain
MNLPPSLKSAISQQEKIEKVFSFGERYILVRLILSLVKWFFVAILIGASIIVAYMIFQASKTGIISFYDMMPRGFVLAEVLSSRVLLVGGSIFIVLFAPILLFYHLFYLKLANTFVLTDHRIIVKKGWLNTTVKSADYNEISDIEAKQGFFERIIYNTGTVMVSTPGSDGYELNLSRIANPYEIKKRLYEIKERITNNPPSKEE